MKPDEKWNPRTPFSRTACFYDAFAQMLPGVRFHSSDDITRDEGAPISRKHRAWHIQGVQRQVEPEGEEEVEELQVKATSGRISIVNSNLESPYSPG